VTRGAAKVMSARAAQVTSENKNTPHTVSATIFTQIFSRQLLNSASLFNKKAESPFLR
jgi:hypothetical protein